MKPAAFGLLAILAAQPTVVPNIPDLKITLRRTSGQSGPMWTEVVYFKGARQRRDSAFEPYGPLERRVSTTIVDCEKRREIFLNHDARTYASTPIEDVVERFERLKRAGLAKPLPEPTGPDVTITIDSVDTGERRQLGRRTARHVVTTTTTDAAPGASSESGERKQDGWYLDLPDGNCSADGSTFATLRAGFVVNVVKTGEPAPPRDRERTQFLGRARRGFAIEATDSSMKIELVDFSEAPLDDALFAIPGGYRAGLPTPYGGVDMTKPDTLLNRVELYCEIVTAWVYSVFR